MRRRFTSLSTTTEVPLKKRFSIDELATHDLVEDNADSLESIKQLGVRFMLGIIILIVFIIIDQGLLFLMLGSVHTMPMALSLFAQQTANFADLNIVARQILQNEPIDMVNTTNLLETTIAMHDAFKSTNMRRFGLKRISYNEMIKSQLFDLDPIINEIRKVYDSNKENASFSFKDAENLKELSEKAIIKAQLLTKSFGNNGVQVINGAQSTWRLNGLILFFCVAALGACVFRPAIKKVELETYSRLYLQRREAEEMKRQIEQKQQMAQVSISLLKHIDMRPLMQTIMAEARYLVHARVAVLFLLDHEAKNLWARDAVVATTTTSIIDDEQNLEVDTRGGDIHTDQDGKLRRGSWDDTDRRKSSLEQEVDDDARRRRSSVAPELSSDNLAALANATSIGRQKGTRRSSDKLFAPRRSVVAEQFRGLQSSSSEDTSVHRKSDEVLGSSLSSVSDMNKARSLSMETSVIELPPTPAHDDVVFVSSGTLPNPNAKLIGRKKGGLLSMPDDKIDSIKIGPKALKTSGSHPSSLVVAADPVNARRKSVDKTQETSADDNTAPWHRAETQSYVASRASGSTDGSRFELLNAAMPERFATITIAANANTSLVAQAVLEGRTLSLSGRQLDDTKRWQTDKAALMQAQNEAIRDCAMARSVVVVPLLRHNEAFGALLLVDRQDTDRCITPFNQDDQALVELMAAQSIVAIQNSQLHGRLVEGRVRLEAILESISSLLVSFDNVGVFVSANHAEALSRIIEINPYQQTFSEIFKSARSIVHALKHVYKWCEAVTVDEYELKMEDGNVYTIQFTASPVFEDDIDESPQVSGAVLSIDDITTSKRARTALNRFLSPALANKVMQEQELKLGGVRQNATMLFSDIRSFTSISEKLNSTEVVKLLNDHFEVTVTACEHHSGVVLSFIGDCIMASWGVPYESANDAVNACMAALDMLHLVRLMNVYRLKNNQVPVFIGVGINSGELTSGNIGSRKRLEYTVIGDAVNLAARLEGLTKQYGVELLISEFTLNEIDEKLFVKREIDCVRVVGKKRPVAIYELMCCADFGRERTGCAERPEILLQVERIDRVQIRRQSMLITDLPGRRGSQTFEPHRTSDDIAPSPSTLRNRRSTMAGGEAASRAAALFQAGANSAGDIVSNADIDTIGYISRCEQVAQLYEKALQMYRTKSFEDAAVLFEQISTQYDDKCSEKMAKRCRNMPSHIVNDDDWDGVWSLVDK